MAKLYEKGHKFEAGMVRPVDQNNDHLIDPNDDRVVIGHTRPRWTFGMTNAFSYKNFDFSFMLYGRFDYLVNTGGEWQGGRYTQRKIDYYNENNKNAEWTVRYHIDEGPLHELKKSQDRSGYIIYQTDHRISISEK